jgi:hypothetical protein
MEVHHHSHHPKKWKEYLTEFLMLFLAVTLGFFAENVREHQIEKHREVRYLQNIHQDLLKNIEKLDTTIMYIDKRQLLADSLFEEIKSEKIYNDLSSYYYFIKNLSFRRAFVKSEDGFIQLKTSGGLRLIENKEIISKIQDYNNNMTTALELQNFNEDAGQKFQDINAQVLNVITSVEMNEAQYVPSKNANGSNRRFLKPVNPLPRLTDDRKILNEQFNIIFNIINRNKYIKTRFVNLRQESVELDQLILKEFGKNFNEN